MRGSTAEGTRASSGSGKWEEGRGKWEEGSGKRAARRAALRCAALLLVAARRHAFCMYADVRRRRDPAADAEPWGANGAAALQQAIGGDKWPPESVDDDQDNKGAAQVCARQLDKRNTVHMQCLHTAGMCSVIVALDHAHRRCLIRNIDRLARQRHPSVANARLLTST